MARINQGQKRILEIQTKKMSDISGLVKETD